MGIRTTSIGYIYFTYFFPMDCLCVNVPRKFLDHHGYFYLHKNFYSEPPSDIFYLNKLINNYESMMKYA